jgi:hypothetical protein
MQAVATQLIALLQTAHRKALSTRVSALKKSLRGMAEYVHHNSTIYRYGVVSDSKRTDALVTACYEQLFGSDAEKVKAADFDRDPLLVMQMRCLPSPPFDVVDDASRSWLRVVYDNDLEALNHAWHTQFSTWTDIVVSTPQARDSIVEHTTRDFTALQTTLSELVAAQCMTPPTYNTSDSSEYHAQLTRRFPRWPENDRHVVAVCMCLVWLAPLEHVVAAASTLCPSVADKLARVMEIPKLRIKRIPGNGDCFFTAMGLTQGLTAAAVRVRVAAALPRLLSEGTTPGWQVYRDALPVEDSGKSLTSLDALQAWIVDSQHWATDFDLRICSALFGVHIMLVSVGNTYTPLGTTHVDRKAPFVAMYYTQGTHFDLLTNSHHQTVFTLEELPSEHVTGWTASCGELDFKSQLDPLFE